MAEFLSKIMRPYAFRTFNPFGTWDKGTSSAEWSESLALEVGDRVSEHEFMEQMWQAWALYPWVGVTDADTYVDCTTCLGCASCDRDLAHDLDDMARAQEAEPY